jgi:hypothetical protein
LLGDAQLQMLLNEAGEQWMAGNGCISVSTKCLKSLGSSLSTVLLLGYENVPAF